MNENKPFWNWSRVFDSGTALKALHDYEREFQQRFAPITYEEGSELDPEDKNTNNER